MTPQELKNSILQLAIQGKLVEQRPEEGSAEELYAQIQKEKQNLIKEGKIKKEKPLPEITDDEKPFDIPESWKWVRFSELFEIGSAIRIHQSDWKTEGIPFFRGRELVRLVNTGSPDAEIFISKELYEKNKEKGGVPQKDDLLVTAVGTLGKVYIVQGTKPFYYKDAYILRYMNYAHIDAKFFKIALESPFCQQYIHADSMGTTVAQLTIQKAKKMLCVLPPLAEQKRIVARIEELMPLVDSYEQAWTKLEAFNKKFPVDMQKSILQMAIQGKLVEQRPEEGSAEELYKEIQAEKQKLIKEGKIKKDKPLPEITDDEKSFDIPESWKWVRLGDVGSWASGATPFRSNPDFYGGSIPWLKTGDLNDSHVSEVPEYITEEALKKTSVRLNPVGSVLMAMYGATIGKLAILDTPMTTNQACCACITFESIYNEYLFYFLMGYRKSFIKMGEGGAQPNISKEKIISTLFPLPPLAEQKRIVAKIEELMPYCELLKS